MLISRCTEWEYREFEHPLRDEFDQILRELRLAQDERGLHLPSRVPDDLRARLDAVASEMPELQLWDSFVREWEVALYELTHLARGLFGVPIAEALHLRSSGRSGKDTVVNLMELLAGSYSYTVNHAMLCEAPQGDGPSQSLAMLRARRVVSVREAPTGDKHKIRADIYKRLCDPFSKIVARPLYGNNIVFSPQHLCIYCSNGPS
jgi:hypothetical protein